MRGAEPASAIGSKKNPSAEVLYLQNQTRGCKFVDWLATSAYCGVAESAAREMGHKRSTPRNGANDNRIS